MDCHFGYDVDYDLDNYGTKCISENHPAALKGCHYYSPLNKNDN